MSVNMFFYTEPTNKYVLPVISGTYRLGDKQAYLFDTIFIYDDIQYYYEGINISFFHNIILTLALVGDKIHLSVVPLSNTPVSLSVNGFFLQKYSFGST